MKLSTKGRYAILAMYELAQNTTDKPMSVSVIAKNQAIPDQYLVQLLKKLRESNLVESTRGVNGGYKLAKNPDSITVGEIIRSVEEQTRPVECFGIDRCSNFHSCAARTLWDKVAEAIDEVIDNETLADMLNY